MSESEVTKHAMRTYRIWKQPGINWKHKITEIIIEIFIIVFAVSLSLYFERWREQQHDKKLEKNFLTGLRYDLQSDINELESDAGIYEKVSSGFRYFYSADKYDADSVKYYGVVLGDYTQLIPNTNRYEALKSSGKLDVIENPGLLDSIVDLYQDKIPGLIEVFIKPFNDARTHELFPFLNEHIITSKDGYVNLEEVLRMPVARNFLRQWDIPARIANRYQAVVNADKNIITQIDKEFK